jgi:hypothetical protein
MPPDPIKKKVSAALSALRLRNDTSRPTGPKSDDPAILLRAAMWLGEHDHALRKAFEAGGLDPANPLDWRELIGIFAQAHFGETRKGGRPEEWTPRKLAVLMMDFAAVRAKHPKKGQRDICKRLVEERPFAATYGDLSPETLRGYLKLATDQRLMLPLYQMLTHGTTDPVPGEESARADTWRRHEVAKSPESPQEMLDLLAELWKLEQKPSE